MADEIDGPTRVKKSRRRWWILGGALVAVAAVAGGWFLLRPQPAQSGTTRTFSTPVTKTTENVQVNLTGTLAPQHEADLSFATSGKVTAVKATVGQSVAAGDLLATIDDTQLKNAVTLAQANVDAAQTSYDTVAATTGVTDAQLSNARAQVDSANAKLASAQASLAQAQLTTPIAGTVASISLTVGAQTGSGSSGSSGTGGSGTSGTSASSSAQVVVISPDSWLVNSSVGPADVASIKPGEAVTATVNGTTVTATGKVNTVGIVATTSGGSTVFPVSVLLDGNPAGLYDGVSVNLVVTTGTYPDVLSVPTAALSNSNGTVTVDKVVGSQAVATEVQTGKVFGDRTQVLSGLAEGDQVQITVRTAAGAQRTTGSGINIPGLGGGQAGGTRQPGGFGTARPGGNG